MEDCRKCLHEEVCVWAKACDGHVPRCKHFMDKTKYVEGETYTEEDVRNAYQAGYSTGMEQGMEKGKDAAVKHGRWIPLEYDGYADGNPVWDLWECSECQEEHSGDEDTLTPYCPNCGAKMDSTEDNQLTKG